MYSKLRWFSICFLFVATYSIGHATDTKELSSELQILIDVSGSMKHNDPKNLRIPALKLLINLLPNGTQAGVWLFAERTKVLVKTGVVNRAWKKKALSKIKKIHSLGLFTNIEDAIQTSSNKWFEAPEDNPRHLILLTDGVVDVSKDIMESAESRERIIIDQISQLQQTGVKVHTIALSDNADTELLEKLAFDTNGWNETVQHAEQLQKIFLKIFKQAIPTDTVPITGNSFTIDSSVDEFSVLLFKKKGGKATQLISPDKTKISEFKKPEHVSWLSDKNYDLITIKKTKAGKWKIVAEMDPDNQVMIVTDLKLQVEDIPNHISDQDTIDLNAYFTDKHQLISQEDFLNLIDISVELINEKGEKNEWKMEADTEKVGLFNNTDKPLLRKGKYTIKIKADGKTFQREFVQAIDVVKSLMTVKMDVDQKSRSITIKLIPDKKIINTEMLSIQASITQIGQATETHDLINKHDAWVLVLDDVAEEEGKKIINFSIIANSLKGDSLSPNVKPIVIDERLFSKPKKTVQDQNEDLEEPESNKLEDEEEEIDETLEEDEDIDWVNTVGIVIGINIVFILAGFFLFKFFKKRAAAAQAQLLARLE
ncbi:MAG: VWA domain-containing protein [Methylococcales bacterium]|nr:VWA domain-containing protein [Methylococcales bacterium]